MQILVDADACPVVVRKILYRTVDRLSIPLVLVANRSMPLPNSPHVSIVIVSDGPDAADDRIVELALPGDLVITADIPLADRIISKQAFAINPRGELYTETNVKQRLAVRDLMADLRDMGEITGGPGAMRDKDTAAFANQLDKFLTKRLKKRA